MAKFSVNKKSKVGKKKAAKSVEEPVTPTTAVPEGATPKKIKASKKKKESQSKKKAEDVAGEAGKQMFDDDADSDEGMDPDLEELLAQGDEFPLATEEEIKKKTVHAEHRSCP